MAQASRTFDTSTILLAIIGLVAIVAIFGIMQPAGFSSFGGNAEAQNTAGSAFTGPISEQERVTCIFIGGNGTKSCYVKDSFSCSTQGNSCSVMVSGKRGTVLDWSTTNCAGASATSLIDGKEDYLNFTCESAPSCTNECIAGATRCYNESVERCGNYDTDPCTEWGFFQTCAPGSFCSGGTCIAQQSCFDSDGGINIWVAGAVLINGSLNWTDTCYNGTLVDEKYCDGTVPRSTVQWCGEGVLCSDGACVNESGKPKR